MTSGMTKVRWLAAATALLGALAWGADRAHAVVGEGENYEYWADSGGGYCAGKCGGYNGGSCC